MPLPAFIQRSRRSLQRIDYYAARRPGDRWSRARRHAVGWSVPVGLVAMLLTELIVVREQTLLEQSAIMRGERSGPIVLSVETDVDGALVHPLGRLSGQFSLRTVRDEHGWPFATRASDRRVALDLNEYLVDTNQIDVRLAEDDALWPAFERVARENPAWLPATRLLRGEEPGRSERGRRHLTTSVLVWGAWSMGIAAAAVVGLHTAEISSRLIGEARVRRRRARSRANRCAACGYDMRGLDFHPRCPECGALVE